MTGKFRFAGSFLGAFALLILVAWAIDASVLYATLLEKCTSVVSPAVHGWWLVPRGSGGSRQLWFRSETHEVKLQLSLEALSLGLLPFLSLLSATPGLGVKRWVAAAIGGSLAFLALDLLVLLAYPALVTSPNALTDITGTFLGMLSFVGAPVILWFLFTYDRLNAIWRFERMVPSEHTPTQGNTS